MMDYGRLLQSFCVNMTSWSVMAEGRWAVSWERCILVLATLSHVLLPHSPSVDRTQNMALLCCQLYIHITDMHGSGIFYLCGTFSSCVVQDILQEKVHVDGFDAHGHVFQILKMNLHNFANFIQYILILCFSLPSPLRSSHTPYPSTSIFSLSLKTNNLAHK